MPNQRKSKGKSRAKRATPRKAARNKSRPGFSLGTFAAGMIAGIALTLTGALLPGFLDSEGDGTPEASSKPAETEEPINFKFYDRLPRAEVDADTSAYEALAPHQDPNASFILQAGSFVNRTDADRLRGQLLLTNLNVKVQTVKLPSGSTVHRVMVGPFDNEQDTTRAMTRLREENIDPLKLALKPPSR
jgi:cell division protein FtsN